MGNDEERMDARDREESPRAPRIGDEAPDFEADTTHGSISLSDYKGKWVVLFSYTADFTPVCTTEIVAFSQAAEDFEKKNARLIGLSVDSVFSHIAWVRLIEEKFGIKVPFPLIADQKGDIARMYGMIHEEEDDTAPVRSLFIIDPDMIVRAIMHYPMSVGRNIPEVLRLLEAIQTSEKKKAATPADWSPGDMVVVPPPTTVEEAEKRLKQGYDCVDWFLCKKE